MASAVAIRSAVFPSVVLSAMLVWLTPNITMAECQNASPVDLLSHEVSGGVEPHTYPNASTTSSPKTNLSASEAGGDSTLAENAWDFTKPDRIPGFASTPFPIPPSPEIDD